MEPRCSGSVSPCAISRPRSSHSADDRSMALFRLAEYAVRTSVSAISSTIACRLLRISSAVIGSIAVIPSLRGIFGFGARFLAPLGMTTSTCSRALDQHIVSTITTYAPTRRHERGGIILLDNQWTLPCSHLDVATLNDGCFEQTVLCAE